MNDIKEEKIINDVMETLGKGSLIQHGQTNKRIYLMKLHPYDAVSIVSDLDKMANAFGYEKVIAKIPSTVKSIFQQNGYAIEATIPNFFPENSDAVFLSKYFNSKRGEPNKQDVFNFNELLKQVKDKKNVAISDSLQLRELEEKDVKEMTTVFSAVFETYPFPIHDPEYLKEVMASHVRFWGAFKNGKLIGVSSAEMDEETRSVEMTDFAVLPQSRGLSIAYHLLRKMEDALRDENYKTAFTIARIKSLPMNKTFLNCGYKFAGTLINNTNISGQIESMNVHFKKL